MDGRIQLALLLLAACGPAAPVKSPAVAARSVESTPPSDRVSPEPAALDPAPAAIGDALPTAAQRATCSPVGKRVEEIDLNGDGRPDARKLWVVGPAGPVVSCKMQDFNFDGTTDATTAFEATGAVVFEHFDLDFDGVTDASEWQAGGKRRHVARDTDRDGRIDVIEEHAAGQLQSVERDRNGDGRADQWERHAGGRLLEVRTDDDFDGKADRDER